MAATYTNTPISIPDVFAAIVAEVAVNLGIAIKFKHGTWIVIQDELIADSSSTDNDVKNWANCICLIHDTDEKPFDPTSSTVSPRLVLVCKSEETWKSQKRNNTSYIPTLYPMYAELCQVIADSSYFLGYNNPFTHTKRDLYHIGQETSEGKDGYKLPKVLDGLIVEGASLKLNLQPMCSYVEPNLCLLTPCEYGLETYYRNIFENVTFTGLGTAIIAASVNDWDWFDATGGLPPPFAPEIDWQGDGSWVAMTAGAGVFTASFNTALGYGDGFYIGQIKNALAIVEFYYKIVNGVITKMVTEIDQEFEYSVLCEEYPAYPATMIASISWDKAATESYAMESYELKLFGVSKYTASFAAAGDYDKTTTTTLAHMAVDQTIKNIYGFGSQSPLTMTSIYKTRCKTAF